ncbi:MAG: hypothetical protein ABF648_01015 [Propionibacterium sp.]
MPIEQPADASHLGELMLQGSNSRFVIVEEAIDVGIGCKIDVAELERRNIDLIADPAPDPGRKIGQIPLRIAVLPNERVEDPWFIGKASSKCIRRGSLCLARWTRRKSCPSASLTIPPGEDTTNSSTDSPATRSATPTAAVDTYSVICNAQSSISWLDTRWPPTQPAYRTHRGLQAPHQELPGLWSRFFWSAIRGQA